MRNEQENKLLEAASPMGKKTYEQIKVFAVVVTYNRKDMLLQCINAILKQSVKIKKLIIIDNNSIDGTEELLKRQVYFNDEIIYYQKLSENLGGAGGFHEGMRIARGMNPDWVWIMDDDVIPENNCLAELLKADEITQEEVSFYASAIRNMEGMAMNVPKLSRKQFMKYTDWYQYLDYGIVKIVKATFVSLLINGKAIQKCGLPWAPFFIWGDDSEYTQRVIRDFGPAYMVGTSKAVHMRGSGEELSIVKETNINRIPMYFYLYRNNLIGFWEYENILYKFLCMGKLGLDFFAVLFKAKYKMRKIKVILKAFFSFVFGTYNRKNFRERAQI